MKYSRTTQSQAKQVNKTTLEFIHKLNARVSPLTENEKKKLAGVLTLNKNKKLKLL